MSDQSRVGRGVPSGGQFAASAKPEPDVALGVSTSGPDQWMKDQFGDDADAVAEALGHGEPLTENQQRLLGALLSQEYGGTPAEQAEEFESCAPGGYVDVDTCATIADRVSDHHVLAGTKPDFTWELTRDSDGVISGYDTSVYLGHDTGGYLTDWHDIEQLGDSRRTGLRAAVDVAEQIEGDWKATVAKARRLGLIGADGKPREDPAARWVSIPNPDDPNGMPIYEGPALGAASRLVDGRYTAEDEHGRTFTVAVANGAVAVPADLGPTPEQEQRYPRSDWQYQVGNGDTSLGYSDWVASQVEMEDGDE